MEDRLYRGMSGCLRNAVYASNLTNKFNDAHGTIFNDKLSHGRRFKWIGGLKQPLTSEEQMRYTKSLDHLLRQHDLRIKRISFGIGYDGVRVTCDSFEQDPVRVLRDLADTLGYDIIKR